jgi:hypothetical protein
MHPDIGMAVAWFIYSVTKTTSVSTKRYFGAYGTVLFGIDISQFSAQSVYESIHLHPLISRSVVNIIFHHLRKTS